MPRVLLLLVLLGLAPPAAALPPGPSEIAAWAGRHCRSRACAQPSATRGTLAGFGGAALLAVWSARRRERSRDS